jgi:hypothetical protein
MQLKTLAGVLATLLLPFFITAQCGLDPLPGTTTISTASQILNSYYPGQGSPVVGDLSITVGTIDARGAGTGLATNDLVLIIQMQGADISTGNDDSYGDGLVGGTASGYLSSNLYAGNYEYNTVASVSGSTVNLSFSLANSYYSRDFASGGIQTYQVIRIPRTYDLTIDAGASVTAPAWNGSTGGVVVLDAANVFTINGTINASGLGFRGGGAINLDGADPGNTNGITPLAPTDYRWNSMVTTLANGTGGAKGEGIAGTPIYVLPMGITSVTTNSTVEGYIGGAIGRGAPANAGGGATDGQPSDNGYNTGGGGGANAGGGGQGGSGWHGGSGTVISFPYGGHGGAAFAERSVQQFIMGGGGGAGSANNSATNAYVSSGGAGGGIILARAGSFAGNGTFDANGADATDVILAANTDAAGGGGAGGTIIAVTRTNVPVGLTAITANANGGTGGNMESYFDHGPGGGGGGGFIVTNGAFATANTAGGTNGLTRTTNTGGPINNVYGSTPGSAGQVLTLPNAPVLKNANNAASPCGTLPIRLSAFTGSLNNASAVLQWEVEHAIEFSHFGVEHSSDGLSFSPIGQTSFNSSELKYEYTHSSITTPNNYYRLKLVNADGSYTYSNILVLKVVTSLKELSVYPQPARNYININLATQHAQRITIKVINSTGISVREEQVQLNPGNNSFLINNLQRLNPGFYFLKTMIDGKPVSRKIVIAHH